MVFVIAMIGVAITASLFFLYNFMFGKKFEDPSMGEEWFGKGPNPPANEDTTIRSFKINVPEEILANLKKRLDDTRFHEPLEDVEDFQYGFNPTYLRELVQYWRTRYQWRKHEEELNQFQHFKTRIEGLDIHFMRVKPTLPEGSELKVIPLFITHGWPGSFVEFIKIVPYLTKPRPDADYVFEVICPSIPGYGFSETPHRKGFNTRAAARIFVTLMLRLGHMRFYVQGGDWGSIISKNMAQYYPDKVVGVHLNMFMYSRPNWWVLIKLGLVYLFPFLIPAEESKFIFPVNKRKAFAFEESAYSHMQSTKPDTLGSGISDSPAGLAAYLLEKFSVATNKEFVKLPDGGLTKKFTMDELLTNIMIYWVNNNFTAGVRFYKENLKSIKMRTHDRIPITIPSAVAVFPNEVLMVPKMLVTPQLKQLISYNIMPRGGHFAAMEEPQLLADDIWQFVSAVEKMRYSKL